MAGTVLRLVLARCYAIFIYFVWLVPVLAQETPMTFEYKADHFPGIMDFRLIFAEGVITQGTAERFAQFVKDKQISDGAVVIFNSPGGLVGEALEFGRLIRTAGFDTSLGTKDPKDGGVCFSACTLAFLGGVHRTVASDMLFGVHRVSMTVPLTSAEALDIGQITIGKIAKYVSYMGVKTDFVTVLTQTGSENINILSSQTMEELNITTPRFVTSWEIKAFMGKFYVLGTTETNDGIDKIIFLCAGNSKVDANLLYNSTGEYRESTLRWTRFYVLDFDGKEIVLTDDEIISKVGESGPYYISVDVRISNRLVRLLRNTSTLGFKMLPPSREIYAGWHMDFASGKEKVFEYMKTCH